jgi:hypothetical protein
MVSVSFNGEKFSSSFDEGSEVPTYLGSSCGVVSSHAKRGAEFTKAHILNLLGARP